MAYSRYLQPGRKYKVEGWIEERTLGSGGFGTVTLWKNEESGNFLALKRCSIHGEMKPKLKHRWKMECDIMLRLEHENVIKAYPVPPVLDIRENDLPLLAMEYCDGGDLRKVLNNAENCCGLSEFQVRGIIHDVASAVEYLHSKRIIHRDLKPENIVIATVEEKVVYKLIDLGYAKDLDQGSVCTSFVGTMQYLAPELFMSQKYTSRVDYWSFGTLGFECCAGFRPFFHSIPPIKWQNEVSRKHKDDIYGFMNEGKSAFSNYIPFPNHLNRTTRFFMEQWLRYMLLWDPKERGGGIMAEGGRPRCFALLENILSTKVLQVLIVPRNELLTYPISDSKLVLKEVLTIIEQETMIPVDQQELLLASGTVMQSDQLAILCLPDMPENETEEEWIVFLLDKRDTSFPDKVRKIRNMPQKVNDIVTEPRTLTMYPDQKVSWGQSFFFCRQVRKDYDRLISAQRALMLCLLRFHSNFSKLQGDLTTDIGSLQAKVDFFVKCQDYDLSRYEEQSKTGISSEKMFNNWTEIGKQVTQFASLQTEVKRLEQHCTLINQTVMELNRSPYSRSKQESSLKDMEDKALELYTKLRHTPVENRNKPPVGDNMPMVTLLLKLLTQRARLTEDLYLHMGKVVHCKNELLTALPKISATIKKINDAGKRLVGYQLQRQKDMWQLVTVALRQNKVLQQKQKKQQAKGVMNEQASPSNSHLQNSDQSLQATVHNLNLDDASMKSQAMVGRSISKLSEDSNYSHSSSLLDKYTEKSLNVLSENHNTRNRLETMLLNFHQDKIEKSQSDSLDWDFLRLKTSETEHDVRRKNLTAPVGYVMPNSNSGHSSYAFPR